MVTVVISDLHLGDPVSVLGSAQARRLLLDEVGEADQLVILGDALELRAGPLHEVLARARPLLEGLGEAMAGRRIVIVPGNHDHQLARPLLDRHRLSGEALGLASELAIEPGSPGPIGALAEAARGAEVVLAYPGLWIRPDVYAIHGHYLDCHLTVPRPECLAAALMQALTRRPLSADALTPAEYESVLAPMYGFAFDLAQGAGRGASAMNASQGLSRRVWRWLSLPAPLDPRRVAARAGLSVALAALRAARLGRFGADVSVGELDLAGRRAMSEVVARLGIRAPHVIFGHTHRAGPLPGEPDWVLPGGGRLQNSGSWIHSKGLTGASSAGRPYWPGACVVVSDSGPPEVRVPTALGPLPD